MIDEILASLADDNEQRRVNALINMAVNTYESKKARRSAAAIKNNFNRLQNTDWVERRKKACAKNCIPVYCIETMQVYEKSPYSNVLAICRGKKGNKTAGGYHWRYATPEEVEKFRSQSVHGAD